jgi:osmoprotectant transport system permease protein
MAQPSEPNVTVGSKRFTESYVLGEIINLSLRDAGVQSVHRQGLGNTAIVLKALTTGQIDIYPEYTGTILREILKKPESQASLTDLNAMLAPMGLKVAVPLGFNNSYALAMKADRANALGLKTISDIAKLTLEQQSKLRIALSPEFKTRMDGWPALVKGYKLTIEPQRVLEHGLAYGALARGDVDIVDAYTTDAAIEKQNLVLLEDDRQAFPRYDAVLLMRTDFNEKPLQNLSNRLNEAAMAKLNGQAEAGANFEQVARTFLNSASVQEGNASTSSRFFKLLFGPDFFTALRAHVLLVAISSALAGLANFFIGLFPLAVVCWISGQSLSFTLPLVIIVGVSLTLLTAGLGLAISIMFIRFDDTRNIVNVLLMILMYLTPIFYPISIMNETMQNIIKWNPLTSYLDIFRWAFSNNASPTLFNWVYMGIWSTASILLGTYVFKKYWPRTVAML